MTFAGTTNARGPSSNVGRKPASAETHAELWTPPSIEFHHEPLDHAQPSIRLVKVLPAKTPDGLIQCNIHHATTSATYICLSYVWGETDKLSGPFDILVNGGRFAVRWNLLSFLTTATLRYYEEDFWIDALCIDQANISERNHQVQQMGEIYSRANMVIAWLGDDVSVERALAHFRAAGSRMAVTSVMKRIRGLATQDGARDYKDHKRIRSLAKEADAKPSTGFVEALAGYWSRAWITQEIALASRFKFLARETEWDLSTACDKEIGLARYNNRSYESFVTQVLVTATERYEIGSKSLLSLLCRFRDKNCFLPRDRIFSLLSLCSEGTRIDVDYGISDVRLLCRVLRASKNLQCLCPAAVGIYALDAFSHLGINLENKPLWKEDFSVFNIGSVQLKSFHPRGSAPLGRCSSCLSFLNETWLHQKGTLFCLSSICLEVRGHLFWVRQESYDGGERHVHPGWIHYARPEDNLSLRFVGKVGENVKIHPSGDGRTYTIILTLAALLEVLRERGGSPMLCELSIRDHGCNLIIPQDKEET